MHLTLSHCNPGGEPSSAMSHLNVLPVPASASLQPSPAHSPRESKPLMMPLSSSLSKKCLRTNLKGACRTPAVVITHTFSGSYIAASSILLARLSRVGEKVKPGGPVRRSVQSSGHMTQSTPSRGYEVRV